MGGLRTGQEARPRGLESLRLLPGDPGQVTEPRLPLLYQENGAGPQEAAGSEFTPTRGRTGPSGRPALVLGGVGWGWAWRGAGALTSGWASGRAPRAGPWEGVSENVLAEESVDSDAQRASRRAQGRGCWCPFGRS